MFSSILWVSKKSIIRSVVLVIFVLIGSVSAFAQQDSTVEWKTTLQDLEHRLAGLSGGNASGIEDWRTDAEELRASLASFAAVHPEMQIETPESLPEKPTVEALKQQLDKLTTAVDQVIKQSPGSPFHLGTVNVVVSAPTCDAVTGVGQHRPYANRPARFPQYCQGIRLPSWRGD